METLFNDFVREHFGTYVTCLVIALAILIFAVRFVTSYAHFKKHAKCEEHGKRMNELENVCNDLPCKTHGEKLERHGLEMQSLKISVEYLNKNLDRVNTQLSNTGAAFTQQNSPLRITPKGEEVVRRLGMDGMFRNNWNRIRTLIDNGVEQKNAYDINEFCIKYAVVYPEKFLTPEEIAVLKDDAYIQGVALMDYMKIIAVMARDEYFKANGINVKETGGNHFADKKQEAQKALEEKDTK